MSDDLCMPVNDTDPLDVYFYAVVDTYIPPTTSPVSSDDSSFSSDSNSSQYSENSQFLSFTERQRYLCCVFHVSCSSKMFSITNLPI